jgi:hypothetical protein
MNCGRDQSPQSHDHKGLKHIAQGKSDDEEGTIDIAPSGDESEASIEATEKIDASAIPFSRQGVEDIIRSV